MQNRQWIDNLKIAIINNDLDNIVKYSKNVPVFDTLEDAQTAFALIKEAEKLIRKEQDKISAKMFEIRKIKNYLN
ncbi:MAG: hypothetical protein GXO12_06420 [Epsilonproteobacteria bacterium]|nr:hypothetical protein [Campylobacterota bacterium]